MTPKTLTDLHKKHQGKVSDKWSFYLDQYERLFNPLRDKTISLFEIGIQNGGSLEIWSKYFPKAKVFVGCDIDKKCSNLVYQDPRINLVIGDANQKKIQEDIIKKGGPFDIVIDDGSHRSSDIVKSFINYFPHVSDGGLYIVEDLHCSYWEDFEGGLFAPHSSMMFFKYLTDLVNYEHWGVSKSYTDILKGFSYQYDLKIKEDELKNIGSIEFLNSMCIIKKSSGKPSKLGLRVVKGKDAAISDHIKLNSTKLIPPSQINNVFSESKLPPAEEVIDLYKQIQTQETKIQTQETKIQTQENLLNLIINSRSWKITHPLRLIKSFAVDKPQNFISNFRLFLRSDWSERRVSGILKRLESKEFNREVILKYKTSKLSLFLLKSLLNLYICVLKLYPQVFRRHFGYLRYINCEKKEYAKQAQEINKHINLQIIKPKFSIVIDIKNELQYLSLTLSSLQKQVYVRFDIKIIINNVNINTIEKFLQRFDKNFVFKIEVIEAFNPKNLDTDYFIFMKPGQSLSLLALYEFSNSINQQPSDLIYADEDMLNVFGIRSNPFFKPDWSPDFLESFNYINFPVCISKPLVIEHYTSDNLYDLLLRVTENAKAIKHIKKVLGHSKAFLFESFFYKNKDEDITALKARLLRTGRQGEVFFSKALPGSYSIKLNRGINPLVSIVIPTAGKVLNVNNKKVDLILNLLDQIYTKSKYRNFEVIIVDNDDLSKNQLKKISTYNKFKRISFKEKIFNISKKLNLGAKFAKGEFLLLMNDDIDGLSNNWIENMLDHFEKPHVGVVGAKLLYPNHKIQHAGVVFVDGNPDHLDRFNENVNKTFYSHCFVKNYLAVTGAVMMTRKILYENLGGYNENLAVSFNDIDYCLRLKKLGFFSVFSPFPELIHMESASRVPFLDIDEYNFFMNTSAKDGYIDPFFNAEVFEISPPTSIFNFKYTVWN